MKTTKKYKIVGMDCGACARMIELDLEDAGIKAVCSYTKSQLDVEHNGDEQIDHKVREIIQKGGYQITPK